MIPKGRENSVDQPVCPACDNKEARHVYEKLSGAGDLLECKRCGLYYVRQRSPADAEKNFYTKEY